MIFGDEASQQQFELSDDFLNEYATTEPDMTPLGYTVYKRTYARSVEGEDRTEEWWETVRRVVEGVYTIQKQHFEKKGIEWDEQAKREEAREMYRRIFDFRFTPPGRGLWMMGSDFIFERQDSAALFNCAFISTKDISDDFARPFTYMMMNSMLGVGVGSDTRGKGTITIKDPEVDDGWTYTIPDSREGWVDSVEVLLNGYGHGDTIPAEFDYSEIRPEGEELESFGGTASGPDPLKRLHSDIKKLLESKKGETIDAPTIVDLHNLIGRAVVAGGKRRTAQIMFGDPDNEDYITLKDPDEQTDFWGKPELQYMRWASNNSVFAEKGMDYSGIAEYTAKNGEPGYIWIENSKKQGRLNDSSMPKDDEILGTNPCGEVLLAHGEKCNLSESYPSNHRSLEDWVDTLKYAYIYAKTVTLLPHHDDLTEKQIKEKRRLGISCSGIVQAFEKFGRRKVLDKMDEGYQKLQEIDEKMSDAWDIPTSIRLTSVKPSGCRPWNQLTTTDSGILTLQELFEEHEEGKEWSDVERDVRAVNDDQNNKITKTYDNGKQEIVEIELSYGLTLESTPNHEWFVKQHYDRKKGDPYQKVGEWKRADEIQENDIIDVEIGSYKREERSDLEKVNSRAISMRKDAKKISQPDKLNEDLAWFLGYLWGDGAMSPGKYRIRFSDENEKHLEKAASIVEKEFGLDVDTNATSGDRNCRELTIASKHLWHWLIKNGVWKYFADEIDIIPRVIRESSRNDVLSFMAGMIDSDGCVHKQGEKSKFSISTSSELLGDNLQHVSWAVGVPLGFSHNTRGQNKQERKSMYNLTSSSYIERDAFDVLVRNSEKLKSEEERDEFLEWQFESSSHGLIPGKVVDVRRGGRKETFDVEVENSHWYYNGAVKSHNTVSRLANVTSGIHYPTAKHYERNVRFQESSNVLKQLRESGFEVKDSPNDDGTKIVSFPMKKEYVDRSESDVSMWEQLENVAQVQQQWADNSVSVTIKFDPENEADDIGRSLELYEDRLKTVSFLPDEDGVYDMAPIVPISEEEYDERVGKMPDIDLSGDTGERIEKFCQGETCEVEVDPDDG